MPSLKSTVRVLALTGVALVGLNALVRRAASRREDVDLDTVDVPGSFIDIDGQRVHYVEAGRGEPVVLLHGWNGSTFSMRHIIPELAQQHRVVALDLPGYGFSSRSPGIDYSTSGQAELVLRVMDALHIDSAAVLGHSMGGGIAMQLALQHPERVERLVLVDSVSPTRRRRVRSFGPLVRLMLPFVGAALVRRSMVERALKRSMVHDPAIVSPGMIEGYFRPLRVKGHLRAQASQMSALRDQAPYDPRRIRQPALLLWGEHDRVVPLSTGLELAEQIPNAQLAIIRSAGHLPLEEQPAECNGLLTQFLSHPAEEALATSSNGVARESAPTAS